VAATTARSLLVPPGQHLLEPQLRVEGPAMEPYRREVLFLIYGSNVTLALSRIGQLSPEFFKHIKHIFTITHNDVMDILYLIELRLSAVLLSTVLDGFGRLLRFLLCSLLRITKQCAVD